MKNTEHPNRYGNLGLYRKAEKGKGYCRGEPHKLAGAPDKYLPPREKAATIGSNWSELPGWTTWCVLDTKGRFPRGSIFVRDLTLQEQYEHWPKVPLFRPHYASEEDWERYMGLLRHCQVTNNTKTKPKINFQKLHQLIFDGPSYGPFAALRRIHPLDANGQLQADFKDRPHLEALRRRPHESGMCDYMYVTLVCASGDRERTYVEEV